jgi:hypothetical protein
LPENLHLLFLHDVLSHGYLPRIKRPALHYRRTRPDLRADFIFWRYVLSGA